MIELYRSTIIQLTPTFWFVALIQQRITPSLTIQVNHLHPNTPFLLSARATEDWPARRLWINADGSPNLSSSGIGKYKDQIVPVADTCQPEYSEFRRSERKLGDVLDLWRTGEVGGKGLYVKDWHLLAELESEGKGVGEVYSVPECFRGKLPSLR